MYRHRHQKRQLIGIRIGNKALPIRNTVSPFHFIFQQSQEESRLGPMTLQSLCGFWIRGNAEKKKR
jgi:hypothetical protein